MEAGNVAFDTVADQRLATSDANLADAKVKEDCRQAVKLVPGEDFVVIAIVFRVGGTAIDTPEIAAVGDRNAEVGDLAAETVLKGNLGWPKLDASA